MIKVFLVLMTMTAYAQNNCDHLFNSRDEGLKKAQEALLCFEQSTIPSDRESQAHNFNQISYLKFFIAEYFLDRKLETLYEGMTLAEKSVLLFGPKYSLSDYRLLSPEESKLLATALYNYGLITARYVDLMGTMEALKRMGDIKKSMSSIMRISEDATAHYGAHRTMGIFHTKVPAIAGGDNKLAGEYLQKALEMTLFKDGISTYPANNVAYADWLYKNNRTQEACAELQKVATLTNEDIRSMNNGLYFESQIDVKKAQELITSRKCFN